MSSSVLPTENLTGIETILKSFPYATFFMVLFVVVLKTDHAIALYDMAAYELGIGRIQLLLLFLILLFIGTIFWKLLSAYIKNKKEAVRREIVGDTERLSLIRLFDATGGLEGSWIDKTKWFTSAPTEEWKGVFLDPVSKRVNKLILPSNNLSGELPDDIFDDLLGLIEIDFRDNDISGKEQEGPLPLSLLNLKNLQGLYLYDNKMTGNIPQEITKLKKLSGIYLLNNHFENTDESRILLKEKLSKDCYIFI